MLLVRNFSVRFILGTEDERVIKFFAESSEGLKMTIIMTWDELLQGKNVHLFVQFPGTSLMALDESTSLLFDHQTIDTFYSVNVAVLPFGAGIGGGFTLKNPLIDSFKVFSNKPFETIKLRIKNKGEIKTRFSLVRNESYNNLGSSVGVSKVSDFLECLKFSIKRNDPPISIVFVLETHAKYSHIVFPQIQECLEFPKVPTLDKISTHHHKELTAKDFGELTNAITEVKQLFPPHEVTISSAKELIVTMLQLVCDNTAPKEKFSENLRRTVIDIPLHVALGIVNRTTNVRRELIVEEELFTDNDSGVKNPDEIVGSGTLDYVLPDGVVVAASVHDDDDEDTEDITVKGVDVGESIDIEPKIDLGDVNLFQLLAQLHDSMYVHHVEEPSRGIKRTLADDKVERGKLALGHRKMYGILTTGHTWEVYSVTHDSVTNKMQVIFNGKRNLKVLRYIPATKRTSSFSSTEPSKISDREVEEVLYLLLAVLLNKLQ